MLLVCKLNLTVGQQTQHELWEVFTYKLTWILRRLFLTESVMGSMSLVVSS